MSDVLTINEIYLSLQGESTFAGLPCVFVRLTACNLRCSYCDTAYAFQEGKKQSLAEVLAEVRHLAEPFAAKHIVAAGSSSYQPSSGVHEFAQPNSAETSPLASMEKRTISTELDRRDFQPAPDRPPCPPQEERVGERRPRLSAALHPPLGTPASIQGGATSGDGTTKTASERPGLTPFRLPLVELTGGEPLLQKNSLPLMEALCNDGFIVLLETSGALDISSVDPRVRRIVDLKCPSSGEMPRNRLANLPYLKATDEIKFVIGSFEDYDWAKDRIITHKLDQICPLLFSWVHPLAPEQQDPSLKKVPPDQTPISRQQLVEKIIADALPVRFQAQLHKIIWPPAQRGV